MAENRFTPVVFNTVGQPNTGTVGICIVSLMSVDTPEFFFFFNLEINLVQCTYVEPNTLGQDFWRYQSFSQNEREFP